MRFSIFGFHVPCYENSNFPAVVLFIFFVFVCPRRLETAAKRTVQGSYPEGG
jgi:hypothetical protein